MINRIAIIAVTYNRVDSLQRLLQSLENAYYGDESPTLIISIDKSKTDIVEVFADSYNWPLGEKIVRKHEHNLGLRAHMMSLGEWFDRFETLIILEDDIVVSPSYFVFTRQASEQYFNNSQIAGISLYSFSTNYITCTPFSPVVNEYDGYFMNCAMSWGEVWMKNQWNEFYAWYLEHQDFHDEPHLPESLHKWGKSWLKYHTRYCIEKNKYFLYPYVALTTNFADPGTHNKGSRYTTFQLVLQQGVKKYNLPFRVSDAVCYDGFFENKALYNKLGYSEDECCVDLYGAKKNRMCQRYWLTTDLANLPVVRTFGIAYKPLEQNVLSEVEGEGIYLYDTGGRKVESKPNTYVLLYLYNIGDLDAFLRNIGIKYILKNVIRKIQSKI